MTAGSVLLIGVMSALAIVITVALAWVAVL